MKILFTGATGAIGSGVLEQCLAHPEITSVVVFSRRELPSEVSSNPKLEVVIVKDFANWPQGVLERHADAAAMVWMMGAYKADRAVHVDYPLAFQQAFLKVLEQHPERPKFRDVHLSGRFVEQDQGKSLWFLSEQRKMKGDFEAKALAFAAEHSSRWQTFILKPGAVLTKTTYGAGPLRAVMGKNLSIRVEELGAFAAGLAVSGDEDAGLIGHLRMAVKGGEDLAAMNRRGQE